MSNIKPLLLTIATSFALISPLLPARHLDISAQVLLRVVVLLPEDKQKQKLEQPQPPDHTLT